MMMPARYSTAFVGTTFDLRGDRQPEDRYGVGGGGGGAPEGGRRGGGADPAGDFVRGGAHERVAVPPLGAHSEDMTGGTEPGVGPRSSRAEDGRSPGPQALLQKKDNFSSICACANLLFQSICACAPLLFRSWAPGAEITEVRVRTPVISAPLQSRWSPMVPGAWDAMDARAATQREVIQTLPTTVPGANRRMRAYLPNLVKKTLSDLGPKQRK